VASSKRDRSRRLAAAYGKAFMDALKNRASRKQHVQVMQQIAGFVRDKLDAPGKRELGEMLEDYRLGRVPRAAPLALLPRHVGSNEVACVADQLYLNPYPQELMLRPRA